MINCHVNMKYSKEVKNLKYDDVIELLLIEFPEIATYLKEEEYLQGLPHCIFGICFVTFVEKLCGDSREKDLSKVGFFLEKLEMFGDNKIKELVNVSFLEPFVYGNEKKEVMYLRSFLGKETKKDLDCWLEGRQ